MKKSPLIFVAIIFLSVKISSQVVQGKIVDENQIALPGITLNLYLNPTVYNTTTLTDGIFSFVINDVKEEQLPAGYYISNNFPNPFNPKTRIGITLPNSGEVKIEIFNLLGQMVADAIERTMDAGTNFIEIELNGLPNGIYFLRMKIDNKYNVVKKVMLIYGSQHLSVTGGVSNAQLNKYSNNNFSIQNTIIDSLVASSPIIGRKIFTNLPNITGNLLDLGNLIIERYCPETPTVLYEGKLYHTVKIGSQCWLKENLNVGTRINGIQNQTDNDTIEKYCYTDSDANCDQYGGFYQWNETMQYVTTPSAKGICPNGWHLPTRAEFETLAATVGWDGNILKAIGQGVGIGSGTNSSGFSGLLAGYRNYNGNFLSLGQDAAFWSSTVYYGAFSNTIYLHHTASVISVYFDYQNYGLSVRCIKD